MFLDGALRFSPWMSFSFSMSSFPATTPSCSSCHKRILLNLKEIKLRKFCETKLGRCPGPDAEASPIYSQSRNASHARFAHHTQRGTRFLYCKYVSPNFRSRYSSSGFTVRRSTTKSNSGKSRINQRTSRKTAIPRKKTNIER
jgi:hypothetical protein